MRTGRVAVALAALVALLAAAASAQTAPFHLVFRTDAGSAPGVVAVVTRRVGEAAVSLSAAQVPALRPGDEVSVAFVGYAPPATRVRYHANVAFITSTAPERWLFDRSSPRDRLYGPGRAGTALRFTYGSGIAQGTPIFFVVPEDKKTRGMDGVRDYVEAHPTDFKTMAASANQAVDRYAWFRDFLGAFANGQIAVLDGRRRIADVATAFGADPTSIDACYTQFTAPEQIQSCIQGQLNALAYQTNFNAPTQAQFFGGLAGAASPARFAAYIAPLLTIWKLFASMGHQEYEYLPATLTANDADGAAPTAEPLGSEKVPTLRPPAAYSSVVFFSIGEQSGPPAPKVVNDAPGRALCARGDRLIVPLHVDRSSRYLNRTALQVHAEGASDRRIAISPAATEAPLIERAALDDGRHAAYRLRLVGDDGFDPLAEPLDPDVDVAIPRDVPWTVGPAPHRALRPGEAVELIASSAAAPCLSNAELQIGGTTTVPLKVAPIDARHVALSGTLGAVPPGAAVLRLQQAVDGAAAPIETSVPLTIGAPPASVDPSHLPDAHLGDRSVAVHGTGLDQVRALRVGPVVLTKTTDSTATDACFTGKPLTGAAPGALVRAALVQNDDRTGEAFALHLLAARPQLAFREAPASELHLSNLPLRFVVVAPPPRPARPELVLRRALSEGPCAAGAVAVPISDDQVHALEDGALLVALDADAVLHDDAFGPLQIALRDTGTSATSDWLDLPGRFVRAPSVDAVDCTAAGPTCRLVGRSLGVVAAVRLPDGSTAVPSAACVPREKEAGCLRVPRLDHYTLILIDEATPYDLPDGIIEREP